MNQLFSIFAPDKSATLFSDQISKVFNDYIQHIEQWNYTVSQRYQPLWDLYTDKRVKHKMHHE